jgi:orotidine-5'-phosphate decarboxylase
VATRESQIVLGLDPDPARLWPQALARVENAGERGQPAGERAARAVAAHCALVIDAVAEHCVAVKPQVACFERLGGAGWTALAEVVAHARRHDLMVIADAKRGDIDISAAAYGQAFFGGLQTPYGPVAGLGADALTINPLLGSDSVAPLVQAARASAGGVFVLVRTSNPGAQDVEEQILQAGGPVSELLARMTAGFGADGVGAAGLSDVGAVIGATAPERLSRMRALMPHAVFLLPGVGAQGGRVQDLAAAFAPGPAGGLVSASRAIVRAHERDGSDPAQAALTEARRLRRLAWQLVG